MNISTNNPASRVTIRGKINDRQDPNRQRREIAIEKEESRKLPLKDYPLTHNSVPQGLEVELIAERSQSKCQASFHRYPEESRFGEGAHIYTATTRLRDYSQCGRFHSFLQEAGVLTPETEVNLDFEKSGAVIRVYLT